MNPQTPAAILAVTSYGDRPVGYFMRLARGRVPLAVEIAEGPVPIIDDIIAERIWAELHGSDIE